MNHNDDDFQFLTPEMLAEKLDVKPRWLKLNRQHQNPIPCYRFGHKTIRYRPKEVIQWLKQQHNRTVELKFYSIKKAAKLLQRSERWLYNNRHNAYPIRYYYFGGLVRYSKTDLIDWLNAERKRDEDYCRVA